MDHSTGAEWSVSESLAEMQTLEPVPEFMFTDGSRRADSTAEYLATWDFEDPVYGTFHLMSQSKYCTDPLDVLKSQLESHGGLVLKAGDVSYGSYSLPYNH